MSESITPAAVPEGKPSPGPKVLLMADSGGGKTTSLGTLIKAGVTPFVIATEQNCLQVLKGFPKGSYHYKFISPTPGHNWSDAADMLQKINSLSYENLTKVVDPFKSQNHQLMSVMATAAKFVADDDGVDYGDAGKWNTDRALVIDSLSGISDMAMALVVGNKPVRSQPDWGVAQNAIRMLLNIAVTIHCPFILLAHMDREKDEITGGTTITVKTLGQKLGPDLPRMFSDVIRARRTPAGKYVWDTADSQAIVVGRHLPIAGDLEPSFVQLLNNWKEKGGKILPTQVKA